MNRTIGLLGALEVESVEYLGCKLCLWNLRAENYFRVRHLDDELLPDTFEVIEVMQIVEVIGKWRCARLTKNQIPSSLREICNVLRCSDISY